MTTRRIVVEVDAEEIEHAAWAAKERVPVFVAMALANAMALEGLDMDVPVVVRLKVDGELVVTEHHP